ncbi:zinc finger FYVE domain-containing protein 9 isoform X2 [Condylostylus longicornis]|uniref:zinc finger FYVE domain-containing protein 9 isoform X2 n=1 Tax=Condylostylus longicornis TaxID=2530218 RepID=UPI00244DDCC6|nr:zinc finger FYVE domain-containing protein 9 isoform X2 [Condylostylus longicornis]
MDLVDIDKVLDDLELDENNVFIKTLQNSDKNDSVSKSIDNIENKTINKIPPQTLRGESSNLNIDNNIKLQTSNEIDNVFNIVPSISSSSSTSSATTTTTVGNIYFSSSGINQNRGQKTELQQNAKLEKVAGITTSYSNWNSMDIITTVCSNNSFDSLSSTEGEGRGGTGGGGGSHNTITRNTVGTGFTVNERSRKNNGNNRIIAVSQVFNSLDEYRRDVESLCVDINKIKTTEENLKNHDQNSSNNQNNIDTNINSVPQSKNFKAIDHEKKSPNDAISKSESETDIKSDISDLQQDETEKFASEYFLGKMLEDDDSVDGLTSSSSITTSSPSSFSSGPSPRSPSSTDCIVENDLNELNEYDGDGDISSIQSNNFYNKSEEILQRNPAKDNLASILTAKKNKSNVNISKTTSAEEDEILEDSNCQNSIDLVGLSSISSSLYIENSFSSIQSELQEQDEQSKCSVKLNSNLSNVKINNASPSIHKVKLKNDKIQVNDDDVISNESKEVELNKNCDIGDKIKDNNLYMNENIIESFSNDIVNKKDCSLTEENQLEINSIMQKNDEYKDNNLSQKHNYNLPITFGSTMDEISDTELDSMLQDIDNELQNSAFNKEKLIRKNEITDSQEAGNELSYKEENNDKKNNESNLKINVCLNNKINASKTDIEDSFETPKNCQNNPPSSYKDESNHLTQEYDSADDIKVNSKSIDDDINLQNADSFSQASTIEFADLQLQNDLGINDNEIISSGAGQYNVYKNNNNNNKSNRINEDNDNNNLKLKQECDNIVVDLLQNSIINDTQLSIIEKNNIQQVELENSETNVSKKDILTQNSRRPRILNLHITNSTGLSKNSPTLESTVSRLDVLDIDGTAGQTPPASVITNLNSTLSNLTQGISPTTVSPSKISNQLEKNEENYNDLSNIIESSEDILQNISSDNINFKNDNELELPIEQDMQNSTATTTTQMTTKSSLKTPSPSSLSNSTKRKNQIGKVPPFWIPDCEASFCMQCKLKFSLIKRRHHCRACGHVLCSLCCSQKAKLKFLGNDNEVRVCVRCHLIINNTENNIDDSGDKQSNDTISELGAVGGVISNDNNVQNAININDINVQRNNSANILTRSPNPNNPMEYCSTIPPHEQVKKNRFNNKPISVMVPVGVLKREGTLSKGRKDKNVIFSDGIRPGCDLADLDNSWLEKSGGGGSSNLQTSINKKSLNEKEYIQPANLRISRKILPQCDENNSYIPKEVNALPPIYEKIAKTYEYDYIEVANNNSLIERLQKECVKFAVQRNFYVYVKIVKLKCCVNKTVINFTTNGMHHVGQDEIIILLEYDNSNLIPKDIFIHLNEIYRNADKGHPITELGYTISNQQNFLCNIGTTKTVQSTTTNGGFLYIRATFQCLQEIQLPDPPFLIGILIHRWEIPWAKIFPLRLMLRLGAQYRYYPSPHLSIRGRNSVYAEIAQTFINYLADFRNYSYTIPFIKGMFIHMEDRKTSVLIPKNRHDQILKALNNSSDYILALGGNFSKCADGHLVCIQNLESDCPDSHTYSTQAINIQGQPRRVTGASFIVLNGALKSNSGLSGKCSIIEDGLMVHILPQKMQLINKNLKSMQDIDIRCGPIDVDESQTETVSIQWVDDDTEFNMGVTSPIDDKKLDGISSIRVHSGLNYSNSNFIIRWTEVFLIQVKEEPIPGKVPIDISKISEQIARSASTALVPLLDLLEASGCIKIALRVTLHQDNVCYEAGSKNFKLAPLYMNALDNELIPILHKQATLYEINNPIILELIFHILYK